MVRRCIRAVALVLVLAAGAAVGACGSSGSEQADTSVTQPPLSSTTATTATSTAMTTTTTTTPTVTTTSTSTTPTTTTPPATTTTTAQSPGGAPAGCPSAVGGFVRDVQASGTDCGRARDVASAWFAAVHGGAAPDSQFTAAGYSCSGTLSGERASVSCSGSGGASISFTASP